MIGYEDLERAALLATPGDRRPLPAETGKWVEIADATADRLRANHVNDAAFAALASPATILGLIARYHRTQAALAGLVGASDPDELRGLEAALRALPAPATDKAAMIDAIHALIG